MRRREFVGSAHFLPTFGDAGRLVGIVVLEAPSMLQARINAVVRGRLNGPVCGRRT
jgi:hypothetical protein